MQVTIITSTKQYASYLKEAGRLVSLDPAPTSRQGKLLELLVIVIKKYEDEQFSFEKPTPVEAIRFRMEQAGLTQIDLVPYFGSRSRVSEILSGKRPLTLPMIRKVSKGLSIPLGILVGAIT